MVLVPGLPLLHLVITVAGLLDMASLHHHLRRSAVDIFLESCCALATSPTDTASASQEPGGSADVPAHDMMGDFNKINQLKSDVGTGSVVLLRKNVEALSKSEDSKDDIVSFRLLSEGC